MGNFICNQYGEHLTLLNTENIKIVDEPNVRSDKYAICLHFLSHLLNIDRKFAFLIFQGSVATYLR